MRKYKLKEYGLTQDDYDDLLKKQDGRCGICEFKVLDKKLVVDHCHLTGRVRGLLCTKCNVAIGLLRDDPELVKAALRYLENPPPSTLVNEGG